MARQLMRALDWPGADVRLASEFRTFARNPDPVELSALRRGSHDEASRLIAGWNREAWRPDVWFSYHPYYKSPDWIGPMIAQALGSKLVTAEASYSARRDAGSWRDWHRKNTATLQAADCHFFMTKRDRQGLEEMPGRAGPLVALPPFIEVDDMVPRRQSGPSQHGVRLVTVAMMRADVKRESYLHLGAALGRLCDLEWSLEIVGDGAARAEIERAFSSLPGDRVRWHGRLDREGVGQVLASSEVFVWPGIREGYGLVYLEAQAAGLPVVAYDNAGVPDVVRNGETGLLVGHRDVAALAAAIRRFLLDRPLIADMGKRASLFVHGERTSVQARATLKATLEELLTDD